MTDEHGVDTERMLAEGPSVRPLDGIAKLAISREAYTADGQQLMLPIDDLIRLGLLSPELKAYVAKGVAEFWAKLDAVSMSRYVTFGR